MGSGNKRPAFNSSELKIIGKRCSDLKKAKGYTTSTSLVETFDNNGYKIGSPDISEIEKGNKEITLYELRAYKEILGCSYDYLLANSECKDSTNDYINKRTGLNEETIAELEVMKEDFAIREVINKLLCDKDFLVFASNYLIRFNIENLFSKINELKDFKDNIQFEDPILSSQFDGTETDEKIGFANIIKSIIHLQENLQKEFYNMYNTDNKKLVHQYISEKIAKADKLKQELAEDEEYKEYTSMVYVEPPSDGIQKVLDLNREMDLMTKKHEQTRGYKKFRKVQEEVDKFMEIKLSNEEKKCISKEKIQE